MKTLHSVPAAAVILAALSACAPDVDPQSLPVIPTQSTASMIPFVAEQMNDAHAAVVARPLSAKRNGHLGMIYRAYKNLEPAEVLFRRARLLDNKDTRWIYLHAEVLQRLGQRAAAQSAVEQYLERKPDDASARLRYAQLLIDGGENARARAQLDTLLSKSETPDVLIQLAELDAREGHLESAIENAHRSLDVGEPFGQAHYLLSQLYRRHGDVTEANRQQTLFDRYRSTPVRPQLGLMNRVFELNLSDKPMIHRARAAKAAGDTQKAIAALNAALEIRPDSESTRVSLVNAYTAQRDFASAQQHLDAGRAINPDYALFDFAEGRLQLARGEVRPAIINFERVRERLPVHAESIAWHSRALQQLGDDAGAGQLLREAMAIDPSDATTRSFYGQWLFKFEQRPIAIRELESMTRNNLADTARLLMLLGDLYYRERQIDAALSTLRRAEALAADRSDSKVLTTVRNQIARVEIQQRKQAAP